MANLARQVPETMSNMVTLPHYVNTTSDFKNIARQVVCNITTQPEDVNN